MMKMVAVDFTSDEANASGDHLHCLMQFNMAVVHRLALDSLITVWRVKVQFNEAELGAEFNAIGLEAECICSFNEFSQFVKANLDLYGSTLAYASPENAAIVILDWVQANGKAKNVVQHWQFDSYRVEGCSCSRITNPASALSF
ncbi:hypothetical protein MD484_g5791, partial [Candolleomyces efflorescens]